LAYVIFLATFLYAVGFVADVVVSPSIDRGGQETALPQAVLINALLLGLFAIQHSIMARRGFKKWWTKTVPWAVERSTFVLVSSLLLILLFWQWRPLPSMVWEVDNSAGRLVLQAAFWLGWVIVLWSTFLIDHFELFGLKQVFLHWRGQPLQPPAFKMTGLYRYIRHPIMLGFLIAFWATPTMTVGHLLFAAATTAWVLIAIQIEERDLVEFHGEQYRQYQQRVPMLIPIPRGR
jgi:protein-S-isoprenylcysteine O-methyltransferase Ste14